MLPGDTVGQRARAFQADTSDGCLHVLIFLYRQIQPDFTLLEWPETRPGDSGPPGAGASPPGTRATSVLALHLFSPLQLLLAFLSI